MSEGTLVALLQPTSETAATSSAPAVEPSPAPTPEAAAIVGPSSSQGSAEMEIRIPNMGDFKEAPVIEVCVRPGDLVAAEQTLIVLESDKATMDVPAPRRRPHYRTQAEARRLGKRGEPGRLA